MNHVMKMITRTSATAILTMLAVVASDRTRAHAAPAATSVITATLEAHGGLDRWLRMRTMTYRLDGFPLSAQVAKTNVSTVDLSSRANRIEGDGFVVGWDGATAWSTPGPDALGLPPRFFALGSFYFIGMPFVFADDGVVLEDRGYDTFDGKSYRVIQVGYARGTGQTSKDDYTLFIDPATNRLALINHSVTETGIERVTWRFDEWQEVNGLLVPARMTFYPGWNPEALGDGAAFTINDVRLSPIAPDSGLYATPADGVIDRSPAKH